MTDLASLKPDTAGRVTVKGGTKYRLTPQVIRTNREYVLAGDGKVTFDGSALGDTYAFRVEKGGTLTAPAGVNWLLHRNAIGVDQYDGRVYLEGAGRNEWRNGRIERAAPFDTVNNKPDSDGIVRVGQLIVVKQGIETIVRGYDYLGRPNKYVAFIGNPLEMEFPPRSGAAKRVVIEHLTCSHSSFNEALVRWMHGYGVVRLCYFDNRKQISSPTLHKAALQPRGTHMIVDQCELHGSIHAGWLDAKKESNPSHGKVQAKMRAGGMVGALCVMNTRISGYVECASDVDAAFANCEIAGQDPRSKQSSVFLLKANTDRPKPTVVTSSIAIKDGRKLGSVKGHDDKLLREIFARANAS